MLILLNQLPRLVRTEHDHSERTVSNNNAIEVNSIEDINDSRQHTSANT